MDISAPVSMAMVVRTVRATSTTVQLTPASMVALVATPTTVLYVIASLDLPAYVVKRIWTTARKTYACMVLVKMELMILPVVVSLATLADCVTARLTFAITILVNMQEFVNKLSLVIR